MTGMRRARVRVLPLLGVGIWTLALLGACAHVPARPAPQPAPIDSAATLPLLQHSDLLWLQRLGFDLDPATLAEFARLGRRGYLDRQLRLRDPDLPGVLQADLGPPPDPARALEAVRARRQGIRALPESEQPAAREALNAEGNQVAYEAARRELLRALYSPARLQEQMVWFWLNHFSVYEYKADLRWLVGDYAERAIRPHAMGHFRDLVLATLQHPAMLEYLDNDQNAVGHVNENYARELMELHTLGVEGGYSQQDVQQLARILTGAGLDARPPLRVPPRWRGLYRRDGAFAFNPRRHEFAPHTLLGHAIGGSGFDEIENAVTLIVHQTACAHFISRQLAEYFMADAPPDSLVNEMARTFQSTDGDIAAVLRTLLLSPQFDASLGGKYKDPMRYVLAAVRLSYPDRPISDVRPVLNWLRALGEAPFERPTPDGYPLTASGWTSPGQLSRRFEIARAIGAGYGRLFDPQAPPPAPATATAGAFPRPANRLYYAAIEPYLGAATRRALADATSAQEWNTFLLASPDLNYE